MTRSAYPRMRTALAILSIASLAIVLCAWLYIYIFFVQPPGGTGWEQLGAFVLACGLSAFFVCVFIVTLICSLRMALSLKSTLSDIKWGVAISVLSVFGIATPFYVYLSSVLLERLASVL